MSSRAWGTRYDSLKDSVDIDPFNESKDNVTSTLATERPPTLRWSDQVLLDDDLCLSPLIQQGSLAPDDKVVNSPIDSVKSASSRSASVFVASLPTHLEEAELKTLLIAHIQPVIPIKHIKIIRDQRGSLCAFLQVENAQHAEELIRRFDMSSFHGRNMRCEHAKAFRTLFISFRVPQIYTDNSSVNNSTLDPATIPETAMQRIPFSMRIRRPKGIHQIQVLFNEYAVKFDSARHDVSETSLEDPFSGPGLLFHPLLHNEETVRRIALSCGPLEYFRLHEPPLLTSYRFPPPHHGPRAESMQGGIWEVKWSHRDDAIIAIQVLLQLPHIAVSWAHQQPVPFIPLGIKASPARTTFQPRVQLSDQPNGLPPLPCEHVHLNETNTPGSASGQAPVSRIINCGSHDQSLWPSMSSHGSPTQRPQHVQLSTKEQFTLQENHSPLQSTKIQEILSSPICASGEKSTLANSAETRSSEDNTDLNEITCEGITVQKSANDNIGTSDGPPTTPDDFSEGGKAFGLDCATPSTPGLEVTSKGLSLSPTTPVTPMSFHPWSPQSTKSSVEMAWNAAEDATTIFVGGLEAYGPAAWNEAKVRSTFQAFGEIEEVRFIVPANSRGSAFAFVRFTDSVMRDMAIQEAHERVYDGRKIRVQPRASNPSHWRRGRSYRGHNHLPRGRGYPYNKFQNEWDGDGLSDPSTRLQLTHYSKLDPSAPIPHHSTDSGAYGWDMAGQGNTKERVYQKETATSGEPEIFDNGSLKRSKPSAVTNTLPAATTSGGSSGNSSGSIPYNPSYIPQHSNMPWVYPFNSYPVFPYGYVPYTHFPGMTNPPTIGPNTTPAPSFEYGSYPPVQISGHYHNATPPDIHHSPPIQRPPVQPTGFIQSDRGLVPVYHPAAIDMYMANNAHKVEPTRPNNQNPLRGNAQPQWGYFPVQYSYPMPFASSSPYGGSVVPDWISGRTTERSQFGALPPNASGVIQTNDGRSPRASGRQEQGIHCNNWTQRTKASSSFRQSGDQSCSSTSRITNCNNVGTPIQSL